MKEHYQALHDVSARQKDAAFWKIYRARSGIEGTISQGVRAFGLRQSRYRGMQKNHLQHTIIATAMNLLRMLAWLDEEPLAPTCTAKFVQL